MVGGVAPPMAVAAKASERLHKPVAVLVVTSGGQEMICGATVTDVMVGSLISEVLGSSELSVTPLAKAKAWLVMADVVAGSVLIVASNVTMILSPGSSVPMLRLTWANVANALSITTAATHLEIEIVFIVLVPFCGLGICRLWHG